MRALVLCVLFALSCEGCSTRQRPGGPQPPITFEPYVVSQWARQYDNWRTNEWATCLYGEDIDGIPHVDDQRPAVIYGTWPDSVTFACLPFPRLVGFAHSHPNLDGRSCRLSKGDYAFAFKYVETRYVQVAVAVCRGSFAFTMRDWQLLPQGKEVLVMLGPEYYPPLNTRPRTRDER